MWGLGSLGSTCGPGVQIVIGPPLTFEIHGANTEPPRRLSTAGTRVIRVITCRAARVRRFGALSLRRYPVARTRTERVPKRRARRRRSLSASLDQGGDPPLLLGPETAPEQESSDEASLQRAGSPICTASATRQALLRSTERTSEWMARTWSAPHPPTLGSTLARGKRQALRSCASGAAA